MTSFKYVVLDEVRRKSAVQFEKKHLFDWFCNSLRPATKTIEESIQEVFSIVGELDDDDKDMRVAVLKERIELLFDVINEKTLDAKIIEDQLS